MNSHMDKIFHYTVEEHLDQIKEIVEKVYNICGTVNKEYIDELINNYDEIVAICDHKNILKSIAILENTKDTLIIKLVCSKSSSKTKNGGTNIVEKCEEISKSRNYTYVKLDSIHKAYGFYRKLGFISSTEFKKLDDIWNIFNREHSFKKNKMTDIIGKRISHHNKNRAKTLLERIPLEKKIQVCIDFFEGNPKKMFLDISELIPGGLIKMEKNMNI